MKIDHEEIRPETNPETGVEAYRAWTEGGRGVLSNGAVEDCDCEACLLRPGDVVRVVERGSWRAFAGTVSDRPASSGSMVYVTNANGDDHEVLRSDVSPE